MASINYGINVILNWSADGVNSSAVGPTKFAITYAKLYVPIVTLSTWNNAKLLQQLKSGFEKTIIWNKHISRIK